MHDQVLAEDDGEDGAQVVAHVAPEFRDRKMAPPVA